jgi:hypothetical protein
MNIRIMALEALGTLSYRIKVSVIDIQPFRVRNLNRAERELRVDLGGIIVDAFANSVRKSPTAAR